MNIQTICWCTSTNLTSYSDHYLKCEDCSSLIAKYQYDENYFASGDDSKHLYNKNYWTDTISERSSLDLPERCLYWLNKILKYKLPPTKTLEIGCGHGGLVALMQQAGFQAQGTEMSPWVVDYARAAFGADIICGKIEDLELPKKSYDCIIMLDVLEHLSNPNGVIEICADLLKDDGVLVIQTPCFRAPNISYTSLVEEKNIFLTMMREWEHLFLFSEKGLTQLLNAFGFNHLSIEPQLFPYDIFLFASKSSLKIHNADEISQSLYQTSSGRIIKAMLSLYQQAQAAEQEAAARLKVIENLSAECAARLKIIENHQLEKNSGHMSWIKRFLL